MIKRRGHRRMSVSHPQEPVTEGDRKGGREREFGVEPGTRAVRAREKCRALPSRALVIAPELANLLDRSERHDIHNVHDILPGSENGENGEGTCFEHVPIADPPKRSDCSSRPYLPNSSLIRCSCSLSILALVSCLILSASSFFRRSASSCRGCTARQ